MRHICLCLLMLLACANVAAREVRLSSPDSGACPSDTTASAKPEARKPAAARPREAAPAQEPRVRPSVHSDAGTVPRVRWHSFLPGMFR